MDEHDNNLIVFLGYLIGAVRTVFPGACEGTFDLLNAPQTPPLRVITTSLVNVLDALGSAPSQEGGRSSSGFILALDDYQTITEPSIHELLSSLIKHLPQGMHLAVASRSDPLLPLTELRARRQMTQLRSVDLRFTSEETHAFLQTAIDREVSSETTALLQEKSEGWIVGLRLAALSMRCLSDDETFVQRFEGTSSALIMDYLVSEVLTRQSAEIQDFGLRTSILNRFCAPLCEALTEISATESQEIIERITGANLFLVPLDEEGRWYRYHHLFRDLLRHRLERRYGPDEMAALHSRASRWFEQNSLVEEALTHAFSAGDMDRAVRIVVRHRVSLLNQALAT